MKALFSDKEFNAKHRLGAINSINWARILAQIVYYFAAYFSLRSRLGLDPHAAAPELQFVVPTGNFGDILAGYYAKRMGLPSRNLVVATNENDILQRFWATGRYEKNASSSSNSEPITLQTEPTQGSCDGAQAHSAQNGAAAAGVKATLSPAMDILVSSNFERLLWYLALESQQDNADVQAAGAQLDSWMAQLKTDGRIIVSDKQLELARRDFSAERVSDQEVCIRFSLL